MIDFCTPGSEVLDYACSAAAASTASKKESNPLEIGKVPTILSPPTMNLVLDSGVMIFLLVAGMTPNPMAERSKSPVFDGGKPRLGLI